MKMRNTSTALICGGLLLVLAGSAGAAARIAANPVSRHDLSDLGAATASSEVRLAVTLNYRNKAELDDLVLKMATPGSPAYHQFLTPEQFASRYGPTAADHDRVVSALRAAGFRIVNTYPNRTVIEAAAPAPVAAKYFRTQIHMVSQANHGLRYANVSAATLPDELSDVVAGVSGLDNVVKVHVHSRPATMDAAPRQPAAQASSVPVSRVVNGAFAGLYPMAFATAYDFPSQSGYTGAGHAIAIVIDSDIANTSLSSFWSAAGVTRTGAFNRVLVNGANPGINGDVTETAIDTETTTSLAPAAEVDLFLVESLADAPIEAAYNLAVSRNHADVVSSSFGGCELDDPIFNTATDLIAEQGAALGITFTASTGDAGGYCEDVSWSGATEYENAVVNSPASGPHFLAVGGTALTVTAAGARVKETAWIPGGPWGGGGGGVSSLWPIPAYQVGVPGMAVVPTFTSHIPGAQPHGGFAGRNLPDVALDAANEGQSYIAVTFTAGGKAVWAGFGGTSVACPVFAALIAEQNQKTKARTGLANPGIYATFMANKGAFYDITTGSIGAGWTARAGYDQATGVGSIINGTF
jgi:subtilase family serine protease